MLAYTPYDDVNQLIAIFAEGARALLRGNLRGVYLTGSLSYGAFDYGSSDIDLTVMVRRAVCPEELAAIRQLIAQIDERCPVWAKRWECTFTRVAMLSSILPPPQPRPWYWGGDGVFYEDAPYGNEWIINNYLLYHHAIALSGPEFRELMEPVDPVEVQRACIRDLFTEWEPVRRSRRRIGDSLHQTHFILNLCRILCSVQGEPCGSKQTAAAWATQRYPQWGELIRTADEWQYGAELDLQENAVAFLEFVIGEVSGTDLYARMADEVAAIQAG